MPDGRAKTNDECFWGADCMNALIMFDYDGVIVDSFVLKMCWAPKMKKAK